MTDDGDATAGMTLPEFVTALEHVSEGVIIRDAALNVRYLNDAARKILSVSQGTEVDPAPLQSWDIYDEHGEPAHLPLRDVVANGVSWRDRLFEIRRTSRESQWLRSAAVPFPLADGTTGSISLFSDVSADHRARVAAEQREEYFRLIAENANDVMWRNDTDGICTWISPSVTRILGWRPEDLVGRAIADIAHPEDRSGALRSRASALLGRRESLELRLQRADGSWCPMGVRGGPFLDDQGRAIGTFATARDMTRERLAQHQVEGSERRFRVLAELGDRLQIVDGVAAVAQAGADFVANNVGDGCVVSLLEPGDTVRVVAVAHLDGSRERVLAKLRELPAAPLPGTLSAGVIATGRSVLYPAAALPERLRGEHAEQMQLGASTVMIVPLAAYGHAIGTMTVARDDSSVPLGARDRDLLEEIANRMALAIHDSALRDRAAEAERQFRLIAENVSDVVVRMSPAGAITWLSPSTLDHYGWDPHNLVGRSFFDLVDPDHREALEKALGNGATAPGEHTFRFRHHRGAYTWVSATVAGVRDGASGDSGLLLSLRDREGELQARASLETSERQFRLAMRHSPIGMALVGLDGRWLEVNDALAVMLGYLPQELLQLTFQDVSHPDDLDADLELVDQLVAGLIPDYRVHKRYVRRNGRPVWVELRVALVRSSDGEPLYFVCQMIDLDATIASRRLGQRSVRDQITGLVTRQSLLESLTFLMSDHRHPGRWISLFLCDIDGFSALNEQLGRVGANWVLHEVAERIDGRIRAGDSVARTGADEIAVVLSSLHSREEALTIAQQLQAHVAAPVPVPNAEPVAVTVCVGVALAAEHGAAEDLLAAAAEQLARARSQGPGSISAGAAPM